MSLSWKSLRKMNQKSPESESLVSHLSELRKRLLSYVICVAVIFIVSIPFANQIYNIFSTPMSELLVNSTMIATEVTSPLLVPIKLNLYLALLISMPYLFYQAWKYIAPGLYEKETATLKPILFFAAILFYMGVLFAYLVVTPLILQFLVGIAPENIAVMTDINQFLNFMLKLLLAFGIAFQVPVATYLTIKSGIKTKDEVKALRPYLIVGFFVIAMLLTPPDIFSQLFLALPMWLLFELGLLFSKK